MKIATRIGRNPNKHTAGKHKQDNKKASTGEVCAQYASNCKKTKANGTKKTVSRLQNGINLLFVFFIKGLLWTRHIMID